MTPDVIVSALAESRRPWRWNHEAELQIRVAAVLEAAGLAFEREVLLTEQDRIDFLVGTVGVELKVDSSRGEVLQQLHRYAQHTGLTGLVLVTTRAKHVPIPGELNGKPVRYFVARAL